MQVISPPGRYDDGLVYVRVNVARAGSTWPRTGYEREFNDPQVRVDPDHHYLRAHNSHSAYCYRRWLIGDGVPADALTVVRRDGSPSNKTPNTAPGR